MRFSWPYWGIMVCDAASGFSVAGCQVSGVRFQAERQRASKSALAETQYFNVKASELRS